jgi:hypothetical protein
MSKGEDFWVIVIPNKEGVLSKFIYIKDKEKAIELCNLASKKDEFKDASILMWKVKRFLQPEKKTT